MDKLPRTNRQEWHETIFSFCLKDNALWSRPQSIYGIKFERIYELRDAGFLEESLDHDTKAAPAKQYKVTPKGEAYYSLLQSGDLFKPETWGIHELAFYMLAGDDRELFPILLDYLLNQGLSKDALAYIYNECRKTNNAYFHLLAELALLTTQDTFTTDVFFLDWIPDNLNDEWDKGELYNKNGSPITEKRLNTKLSYAATVALNRISDKLDERGLKKHLLSRTASEGLATELALILFASMLEGIL